MLINKWEWSRINVEILLRQMKNCTSLLTNYYHLYSTILISCVTVIDGIMRANDNLGKWTFPCLLNLIKGVKDRWELFYAVTVVFIIKFLMWCEILVLVTSDRDAMFASWTTSQLKYSELIFNSSLIDLSQLSKVHSELVELLLMFDGAFIVFWLEILGWIWAKLLQRLFFKGIYLWIYIKFCRLISAGFRHIFALEFFLVDFWFLNSAKFDQILVIFHLDFSPISIELFEFKLRNYKLNSK